MLEELIQQFGPEAIALAFAALGMLLLAAFGKIKVFIAGTPMKWDDRAYNLLRQKLIEAGEITEDDADTATVVRQKMKGA